MTNPTTGQKVLRYRIIRTGAGLVRIAYLEKDGFEFVKDIRIVESGIAFVRTDCSEFPMKCKREIAMAQQQWDAQAITFSSMQQVRALRIDAENNTDYRMQQDDRLGPELIFFKYPTSE